MIRGGTLRARMPIKRLACSRDASSRNEPLASSIRESTSRKQAVMPASKSSPVSGRCRSDLMVQVFSGIGLPALFRSPFLLVESGCIPSRLEICSPVIFSECTVKETVTLTGESRLPLVSTIPHYNFTFSLLVFCRRFQVLRSVARGFAWTFASLRLHHDVTISIFIKIIFRDILTNDVTLDFVSALSRILF